MIISFSPHYKNYYTDAQKREIIRRYDSGRDQVLVLLKVFSDSDIEGYVRDAWCVDLKAAWSAFLQSDPPIDLNYHFDYKVAVAPLDDPSKLEYRIRATPRTDEAKSLVKAMETWQLQDELTS